MSVDGPELAELSIPPEIREYIEKLASEVEDLEGRVATQRHGLQRAHEKIEERNEVIDGLIQRVADLEERTDLQSQTRNAGALKVEERAAVCIQTLVNKAQKRKQRGEKAAASMDYNGADDALGGTLDRRQLLDALKRADRIVEGDVVRFKKEKRSAKRNSRLIVDLTAGKLPREVAGVRIQGVRGDE